MTYSLQINFSLSFSNGDICVYFFFVIAASLVYIITKEKKERMMVFHVINSSYFIYFLLVFSYECICVCRTEDILDMKIHVFYVCFWLLKNHAKRKEKLNSDSFDCLR